MKEIYLELKRFSTLNFARSIKTVGSGFESKKLNPSSYQLAPSINKKIYKRSGNVLSYDAVLERVSKKDLDKWDILYLSFIKEMGQPISELDSVDLDSLKSILRYLNIKEKNYFFDRMIDIYQELEEFGDQLPNPKSLLSFLRFYPMIDAYSEYDLDYTLDTNGMLGAALGNAYITLHLVFNEKNEVVYSSYDSEQGMVSIIGRSNFSDLLVNSRKIKKIFRILEG